MGLWRVIWEIDVEGATPEEAAHNARDAYAMDQASGQITVVEFRGDDIGEPETIQPFSGPHPGVNHRQIISFNPNEF